MKVKKIVAAYKVLGEAKVTKLEESEVIKIIKARKMMRPIAEEFEAILKDAQEKLKPECWEDVQEKLAKWQTEGENTTLTDAEKKGINKALIDYQNSINKVLNDELERDVEINIETLKEESATKLIVENGWELKKLEEIEVVL